MKKVTVGAVQMGCSKNREENIEKALRLVSEAADAGAEIVLLPELFEREYFCQERRYESYAFAEPLEENEAIARLLPLSKERQIVVIASFYEKDRNSLYNSAAVLDCGKVLGVYRKTHIPDDHYYQEKFYFSPGDTGFKTFSTTYGEIGIGICWDQWFPETARCLVLSGAKLLFFPSAIGSEPILGVDSREHWTRVMQGHAAANIVPVVCCNRVGVETVSPSKENGGQSSSLDFYGSSFICDETGKILKQAGREECVLTQTFDLDEIDSERLSWGLFRDRRPEEYGEISKKRS